VGLEATRVVPDANLIAVTANDDDNDSLKPFWDYTLALRTIF